MNIYMVDNDFGIVKDEERCLKNLCRVVYGDLGGNFWMLNREEFVFYMKLGFSFGD